MMMYHFPTPTVAVSSRFTLSLVIAMGVALLIVVLRSSPLFIDAIVVTIDWFASVPLLLILILPLLIGTIAAGAWATYMGIRENLKRTRKGKRRKVRA